MQATFLQMPQHVSPQESNSNGHISRSKAAKGCHTQSGEGQQRRQPDKKDQGSHGGTRLTHVHILNMMKQRRDAEQKSECIKNTLNCSDCSSIGTEPVERLCKDLQAQASNPPDAAAGAGGPLDHDQKASLQRVDGSPRLFGGHQTCT